MVINRLYRNAFSADLGYPRSAYFIAPSAILTDSAERHSMTSAGGCLSYNGGLVMDSFDEMRYQGELERLGNLLMEEIDDRIIELAEVI